MKYGNGAYSRKNGIRGLVFFCVITLALLVGGAIYAASVVTPMTVAYSAQSETTMQGFSTTTCVGMDTYTTQVLVDIRNSQNYRVRKMPDGRCWMIDNLKLANYTLTSADSDVSANFTIPANPVQNGATRTNGVCDGIGWVDNRSGLTCDGTDDVSAGDGTNFNYRAYSDPAGVENANYENCVRRSYVSPDSTTGCGYLYNWYTATAGTGVYGVMFDDDVSSSICPAGWKLPTGGVGGEFAVLGDAMGIGSSSMSGIFGAVAAAAWYYNGPFEGAAAGYYGTSFGNAGGDTVLWTSTAEYDDSAYMLDSTSHSVDMGDFPSFRTSGFGVRCILR